jgi:hypothetical protein
VRILTTVLEVAGVALLGAAAVVAFGLAGTLAFAGGACVGLSYVLTRGGNA